MANATPSKRRLAELAKVASIFEKRGFVLLDVSGYENRNTPLPYICICGVKCATSRRRAQEGRDGCAACTAAKTRATCLARYNVAHPFQNLEVQAKIRKTMLERYGVENVAQSEVVQAKMRATTLARLGVENAAQSEEVQAKMRATTLAHFGVENAFQSEEVQSKIRTTNRQRLGVDYPMQNAAVREKSRASNQLIRGVDNPSQSPEVRAKIREITRRNYGVDYPLQSAIVREKTRTTCRERYGVDNPMQNKEVYDKARKAAYKLKKYVLPSGTSIEVQGYEPACLNDLLFREGFREAEILDGYERMPTVNYILDGRRHIYYPDVFLPTRNKLIEVKSTYTVKTHLAEIAAKFQACRAGGFDIELRVYDSKGNRLLDFEVDTLRALDDIYDAEVSEFLDECWIRRQDEHDVKHFLDECWARICDESP